MDAQDLDRGDIFESLWLLRASYAYRSEYDARGMLSIPDAIAFGERLLRGPSPDDRPGRSSRRQRTV